MTDLTISGAQCRAARALINWSQDELARAAQVARKTITDFESGARVPYKRTVRDLERALEAAGVAFIPGDGRAGPGVRLAPGR